jgi:hypothetical protein
MPSNENIISYILAIINIILIILGITYVVIKIPPPNIVVSTNAYLKTINVFKPAGSVGTTGAYNLCDYYIKTAYNCCSIGDYKNSYVKLAAMTNILKQGVRALDFEIFNINEQPVVATSTSNSNYVKETYNSINFSDIMDNIVNYAFDSNITNNYLDPVIIHIRFKSTNVNMYNNLASIFEQIYSKPSPSLDINNNNKPILLDKQYSFNNTRNNVSGNLALTPLKAFMGQIIVIVDKAYDTTYTDTNFYEFVNLESNSIFMKALTSYEVTNNPDLTELATFNMSGLTIVLPDKGANPANPDYLSSKNSGCQMIAMRYQLNDLNLQTDDDDFNTCGYAYCLKPTSLIYTPETIPTPSLPPADQSYAIQTAAGPGYSFNI